MSIPTPQIQFPPELPVSQMRDELAEAIEANQVVIVAGETGSGKTTQLPKIALSLGRTRIAHTQPRRIAARTIAERIAEELGDELGGIVGYQVRFTDQVSERTQIKLMTDGILLNEIHRDRDLKKYDTIIIDEAHERSLNIDFLLGYLKTLLPRRPDLKVIITSATIDPVSFSKHFNDAPVIEVSGRTFPVEIRYRPLVTETTTGAPPNEKIRREETDLFEGIVQAVGELAREEPGDVLVFLSGEAEIKDAADALGGHLRATSRAARTEVLPLYGRLTAAEQHRVFEKHRAPGIRRIVLATNVAETSLTVPGIRYVVDAGTARISRYSARSKVQRLPIEAISQASANQRSGRSGRTSPGIAIRLYAEEDYESRPVFTEPEILRTGLASVILQMLSLGLGDINAFPFLTKPDSRGVSDGLQLLTELGAVTEPPKGRKGEAAKLHQITKIGRDLSRLPIEPRFGRMVLESRTHGVTREVLALVAGLTIQDVRERPEAQRGKADELHRRFADPTGDLITLVNLWNYLQEQQAELSSSAFRRLCKAEFLNFLRVREWMDLYRQLSRLSKSLRLTINEPSQDGDAIHRSVLAGLLSHLGALNEQQDRRAAPGKRKPAAEYVGSRGSKFVLYPGSTLAKNPPDTVMSIELVETSRLFARGNAAIDPEWAEELAGPLAKRSVSEPHWEKRQGAAVAYERVTLYGVPLVERRRIQYARVDQAHARELFLRHALVEGEWDSPQAFDRANRQLRRELEQLEERTRRRDILSDDDAIYAFYDARVPAEVVSTRTFEGWWKQTRLTNPDLLTLKRDDLLAEDEADAVDEAAFPKQWQHGDQTLKLRYRFDPTAEDDGVTVAVPLPLLPRLKPEDFGRLVPGLRLELVTQLIKLLPKAIRKNVVPAADWAKRLLTNLSEALDDPKLADESLPALLAAEIRRQTSVPVTAADFDVARLPAHLTPTFRVVDERGRAIGVSKDLAELQTAHQDSSRSVVAKVAAASLPKSDLERKNVTAWDFGDLPQFVDTKHGGGVVRAYPAIVDRRSSVEIVLVADEREQERLSRRGVRRLVALSSPSPASYVREHLNNQEKLLLSAGPYRGLDAALADISLAVAERIIGRHSRDGLVWQAHVFEAIANEYASKLIDEIYAAVALTAQVLDGLRTARKAIDRAKALNVLSQVADAAGQVDALVFDGFVSRTGLDRLARLPVYLRAVAERMPKLTENPGRDRAWQNEVERVTAAYEQAGGEFPTKPDAPAHLVKARWLIEELRVSLFAQHLRTAEPVSAQRIAKLLRDG